MTAEPAATVLDDTVQALALTPLANTPSSTKLGKSSLKRRKTVNENSDGNYEESSIVVKKSRTTQAGVSNKVDLASVLAKMHSYKLQFPLQNTAINPQSLPSKIDSMSKESSQSPPPPPPPLPTQERIEKHSSASPMAPSLSLPTPSGTPLAEDKIPPAQPSPSIETTNLTPVKTHVGIASENGQLTTPMTVTLEYLSSKKPYINEMHRGGFSPQDIQKAFKKRHNVDLSYEIIQSVISEYSSSTHLATSSLPSDVSPLNAAAVRPRSRSTSTTASSIPGIKHESPLHEALQEFPPTTETSNIFIPLENLSAEKGLKWLESLQSSLPRKIEQLRMKVQEEQAEKERLRREAEDDVVQKHIAEIKTKLNELDRMKRGDALDMLNREIEQKRLG